VTEARRPVPVPDEVSAPYWAAAALHRLVLPRCARCTALCLPPGSICPSCHSTEPDFTWEEVEGRGRVRSWTVIRQSFLPGFADEVPFALVDVELDAQDELRMIARLLDGPGAPLGVGSRGHLGFEDLPGGAAVPAFELEAAS
jgi:uncharacterized OB-fold protein